METYRTEEEQVEALKKWWDDNGRSTLAAVGFAVLAAFGWNEWQDRKVEQAENASVRYEELLEAVRVSTGTDDAVTAKTLAERLKQEFPSTTYAQFAALHLARIAVADNELDAAEEQLRWVLTQNPEREIRLLTELRMARVKAAQDKPQEALSILSAAEAGAYEPAYAEAEGDVYVQLGETDKAIAAYERAVSLAAAGNIGTSEALRLKLQSLTPVPARELAATSEE